MNIFTKIIDLLVGESNPDASLAKMPKRKLKDRFKKVTERELIQHESRIGAELFGPIPEGHRREFFCLDEHSWIWYEEWTDLASKQQKSITTRYEIQGDRILKAQDGAQYSYIEGDELENLLTAIDLYHARVMREIYQHDPATGEPLPSML